MRAADLHSRWNDAMNRKDAAGVASLYAPNAVVHDPAYAKPLEGRDAIEQDLAAFFRTLPDLQVTAGSLLESDNAFAVEGRFEGTQTGPLLVGDEEIPASGRHVEFGGGDSTDSTAAAASWRSAATTTWRGCCRRSAC